MNKMIVGGVIVLFVIIVGGAIILSQSATSAAGETIELNPVNTDVYAVLLAAGIEDAVVDYTPEHTIIGIPLTENLDAERAAFFAIGAAASVARQTETITVETFRDEVPRVSVTVESEDVLAFINGDLSEAELAERVEYN
jgi:hypothetical protein